MARVSYVEMQAKSAINRVSGGVPFKWSFNPYRGCAHSCVYCYARETHTFLGMNGAADFEQTVLVKINAPELMRQELRRPSWKRESVAFGSATDPYQPAEGKYRITRQCLEVLAAFANPMSLVTKNTMVQRDIDVLADLSQRAQCSINFTVTTIDPDLARRLEPDTPPPARRLEALSRLIDAGVNAGVLLAPIMPGINDQRESLGAVVKAAADAGALWVWSGALRLPDESRKVFEPFLAAEQPQLLPMYRRMFPGPYRPKAYGERVQAQVRELCEHYGITGRRRFEPALQVAQLSLGI